MANLVVCEGCSRHVRPGEVECPFCGREFGQSHANGQRPVPTTRLSRAALLTFAAASLGAASCGGSTSTGDGQGDSGTETDGSVQPLYGLPPPGGAGGDIAQPYGVPPSGGAWGGLGGTTGSGGRPSGGAPATGGGIAPPYGVPPGNGGAQGAGGATSGGADGSGGLPPAPPYGIPPFTD